MSRDFSSDAESRYEDACQRRAAVIKAWEDLDRPLTSKGSMGQETDHPLVKQMNELDRLCDRLFETVTKKPDVGRPQKAVIKALGPSPAAKLRRVS
jgi:hypothetical protein